MYSYNHVCYSAFCVFCFNDPPPPPRKGEGHLDLSLSVHSSENFFNCIAVKV